MSVALAKGSDDSPVITPGAGDGDGPVRMIGDTPVRKVTDAVTVYLAGNIRSVTVRPGLFAGSVCTLRFRRGGTGLVDLRSDPRAVVAAWVQLATSTGIFAGIRGVR